MDSISTNQSYLADFLLDDAPCGFVVFNDDGNILFSNNTIAGMLGYTKDDMVRKTFDNLLTIAGKIFYQTHFFPLIRLHERAEEIFLTLRSADNQDVPVLVNAKRRKHDDVYENHCVIIPVPNRKKYEDELLEAKKTLEFSLSRNELLQRATTELQESKVELDKQVSRLSMINKDLVQFSNVISHDVQEPIRKIAMFADMIDRENNKELSDVSKKAIDRIKLASKRMRALITCLQQFVNVDTVPGEMAPCKASELISRAKLRAQQESGFKDIELTISALPEVDGHCEQLELLFYHLIQNAIQFRNDSGKVQIRIDSDIIQQNSFRATSDKYSYVDFVRIWFSDNGQGFDNKYKEYVFQLFKKAHTESEGLGFGLALCRKIVENHYGSLTVSSQVGMGTTFTISLPLSSASVSAEALHLSQYHL
jgi:sigma-B regulation protein RsbU (phosphoserine phosphatase)